MVTNSGKGFKVMAVLWLIFISILFFLPGSALPKASWLDKIYFDKWVHTGFFGILIFLWRFYFPEAKKYSYLILILAIAYGFGVEVIQQNFVANRSFDLGDVAADSVGAFAGIWVWTLRYIKK